MKSVILDIIKEQIKSDTETSRRLFHGRGKKVDGFYDLAIDFYKPNLLITLYRQFDPVVISEIVSEIDKLNLIEIKNILVQKRYEKGCPTEILKGEIDQNAKAIESHLTYKLKLGQSQNIGFFLDMKSGRDYLLKHSLDKRVLNLFSYTCSLSVASMRGGASKVVNVDMSKAALNVGKENHNLNLIDLNKVQFFSYDILKSLTTLARKGPFDIVVIDPPSDQGEHFKVERDYAKIVKRLDDLTSSKGVVLACLNSPKLSSQFIHDLFKEFAPQFNFQEIIYSQYESMDNFPEEGLKILVFSKA